MRFHSRFCISFIVLLIFTTSGFAQKFKSDRLLQMASAKSVEYQNKRAEVEDYARANNIPIRIETGTKVKELMFIDEYGNPQYYTTHNENAAKTISTNVVYSGGGAGLSLSGSGILVHEWDAGTVLSTHQEFDTRVTNSDATSTHYHATHVAGTIVASGAYVSSAKGMAFAATLEAYDWNDDESEMASEAAEGALISNHSYGTVRGWDDGTWYGDENISDQEDYLFGFYNSWAVYWDEIAYNAPNYLIVKSAGNDRNDTGDGSYPDDGPYDCIGPKGVAKNLLTVGAVNDISSGYSQPSDVVITSFSSWGPADDSRIKPDIVANGYGLYSTYNTSNTSYTSMSGTSMSAPSVTGSAALLIEHYEDVLGSRSLMTAATLKALIIHTADEAGTTTGPDYQFGWGLMNTESAAAKITQDQTTDVMLEYYLEDGNSYTRDIVTTGTGAITVTIVWTDPAGTPVSAQLDPTTAMLVNDLDLRITQGANTYYAWKLDAANPTNAATNSAENNADNVPVIFNDASANIPTSWQWTFTPSTVNYVNGSSSTSQHPEVEFTATGTYEVSLYSQNSHGNDTETKTAYITVTDDPSGYCEAYSSNPYGYISNVQIGSINNSSGYTNIGGADPNDKYYEDHTAYSTDVTPGGSYSITVTNPYTDSNLDLGIWVDWNRDGDFYDSGEQELCGINNGGEGTFSITVPANAELGNTRMRLRAKYHEDDCISCGYALNGEVEDYTLIVVATWTGTTDSDWATSSNWNHGEVPESWHNIVIPTSPSGGNFPDISSATNAVCNDLEIEASATLSIFGTLSVNGDLTNNAGTSGIIVESDASQTGSLIQSTASVNASVERYIEQTKYHYISSPVNNQNISTEFINTSSNPLPTNSDFFKFDEPNNLWINIRDGSGNLNTSFETQFVVGRGYLVAYSDANYTKTFAGALNSTNQAVTLDRTNGAANEGWNLTGNPYPATLACNTNADANYNLLSDNAAVLDDAYEAIYFWDEQDNYTGSRNDYVTVNQASSANYINPGQGFMVKAATNGAQFQYNSDQQVHGASVFYKSGDNTSRLILSVLGPENDLNETMIAFIDGTSKGLDPGYDSRKLKGNPSISLYSVLVDDDGSDYAIQSLPQPVNNQTVMLGLDAWLTGVYQIAVVESENLANQIIYLEDKSENLFVNLSVNPQYSFSVNSAGVYKNRFELHFSGIITGENEISSRIDEINILTDGSTILIQNLRSTDIECRISLFNLASQELSRADIHILANSVVREQINFVPGMYLIKVESNDLIYTKKVIIQQ